MPAPFDQALVRKSGRIWRRQGGQSLCEVCGANDGCPLRSALQNLSDTRLAKIVVAECGTYVPVISFQDRLGLDGEFNTFRRGRGWFNRVVPGGRVGLYDLGANEMVGFARVTGTHVGLLGDLLPLKGRANHMMKVVPPEQVEEALQKVLYRAYGKTYAAPAAEFCVIEMRRE